METEDNVLWAGFSLLSAFPLSSPGCSIGIWGLSCCSWLWWAVPLPQPVAPSGSPLYGVLAVPYWLLAVPYWLLGGEQAAGIFILCWHLISSASPRLAPQAAQVQAHVFTKGPAIISEGITMKVRKRSITSSSRLLGQAVVPRCLCLVCPASSPLLLVLGEDCGLCSSCCLYLALISSVALG